MRVVKKGKAATQETKRKASVITRAMMQGQTDYSALKKAGFSDKSAHKGLPATFRSSPNPAKEVEKELERWIPAAKVIPVATVRAGLVRARLVMNVPQGRDKAVQSAKLLGQDKEVNMFEPDTRIGINVAVMPPVEWRARYIKTDPSD